MNIEFIKHKCAFIIKKELIFINTRCFFVGRPCNFVDVQFFNEREVDRLRQYVSGVFTKPQKLSTTESLGSKV